METPSEQAEKLLAPKNTWWGYVYGTWILLLHKLGFHPYTPWSDPYRIEDPPHSDDGKLAQERRCCICNKFHYRIVEKDK